MTQNLLVEDVGLEPLFLLPREACYHYTTPSIYGHSGSPQFRPCTLDHIVTPDFTYNQEKAFCYAEFLMRSSTSFSGTFNLYARGDCSSRGGWRWSRTTRTRR